MRYNKKLLIIAVLIVILNMVLATQHAVTTIGYEYYILHPSDANVRYIGSDNTTGGRVLRMEGSNTTGLLKIVLGNWSPGTNKMYSAAFGIVNEEDVPISITHINISTSTGYSYMSIWLHGNRTANANSTLSDPTTVFMVNNGTTVNGSDTTAWTLAPGNDDSSDMCNDVSDRVANSISTFWDDSSHVRFSVDNSVAYGIGVSGRTINNASDYVWLQIGINIPTNVDSSGLHSGSIWIHYTAETDS